MRMRMRGGSQKVFGLGLVKNYDNIHRGWCNNGDVRKAVIGRLWSQAANDAISHSWQVGFNYFSTSIWLWYLKGEWHHIDAYNISILDTRIHIYQYVVLMLQKMMAVTSPDCMRLSQWKFHAVVHFWFSGLDWRVDAIEAIMDQGIAWDHRVLLFWAAI